MDGRAIARQLKVGPNTERRYRRALEAAGPLAGAVEKHPPVPPVAHESSSIERWSEDVRVLLEHGLAPKAIHDRLRQEKPEVEGSYFSVKRLCRRLVRRGGVRPEDAVIRVETAPGEVAQVDLGEVGRICDPERKAHPRAWAFVMALGFRRHMRAKAGLRPGHGDCPSPGSWRHAEAVLLTGVGPPRRVSSASLRSHPQALRGLQQTR